MTPVLDREELERWLKRQPVEVSRVIAFRAAARVLPAAAAFLRHGTRDWTSGRVAAGIVLPQLRATAFAAVASLAPTAAKDRRFAFASASASAAASADAAFAAFASARAVSASAASADAAFAASASARAAAASADAAFAASASARAVSAASARAVSAASASAASAAAWRAIESDCAALDSGAGPQALAASPLWPDDAPAWFTDNVATLKYELAALGDHWRVWTRWIDRIVAGGPFDVELELRRVLRPTDEDWEHKDNPEHINSLLQQIEDERADELRMHGVDSPEPSPAPSRPEQHDRPSASITPTLQITATSSPSVFVNAERKLDVRHNAAFDTLTESEDLPNLPDRLIALVGDIEKGLPRNAPKMLRISLRRYRLHIARKRLRPDIPTLKIRVEIIRSEWRDNSHEEWGSKGFRNAFSAFFKQHKAFVAHARADKEREALIGTETVNETALDSPKVQMALKTFKQSASQVAEAGMATAEFAAEAASKAELGKDLSDIASLDVKLSEVDRAGGKLAPVSTRKRFIVNLEGFLTSIQTFSSAVTILKDGKEAWNAMMAAVDSLLGLLK